MMRRLAVGQTSSHILSIVTAHESRQNGAHYWCLHEFCLCLSGFRMFGDCVGNNNHCTVSIFPLAGLDRTIVRVVQMPTLFASALRPLLESCGTADACGYIKTLPRRSVETENRSFQMLPNGLLRAGSSPFSCSFCGPANMYIVYKIV